MAAMSGVKTVRILGIRGVPAAHGGFETFAERLALYLVERGWRVVVYCQEEGDGAANPRLDRWRGVERVTFAVPGDGAKSTVHFDWLATRHAAAHKDDLCLTLGYNTAVFCALLRLRGVSNVINMDGVEWRRRKWSGLAKAWFWLNDWAGCWLGDHLVADHPGIAAHLRTRFIDGERITMIPYGADRLGPAVPTAPLAALGLQPRRYWTVIARPEPENSVLEVVRAFSRRPRGQLLAVLGRYDPERNPYHREVMAAASAEVRFVGAIYDKATLAVLRAHAGGYFHGHQVGGTNPSLVEAMGAGSAVVAHDNLYNRWVLGAGGRYFGTEDGCAALMDELLDNEAELSFMRAQTAQRFEDGFTWPHVLERYEALLQAMLERRRGGLRAPLRLPAGGVDWNPRSNAGSEALAASRFGPTEIAAILAQVEAGAAIVDVCRQHGIGVATYFAWKSRQAPAPQPADAAPADPAARAADTLRQPGA